MSVTTEPPSERSTVDTAQRRDVLLGIGVGVVVMVIAMIVTGASAAGIMAGIALMVLGPILVMSLSRN